MAINFKEKWKFPLLLPISPVYIFWEILMLLFITADFVLTILAQCFTAQTQFTYILYHYFDSFLVLILALDILISFNTCFIQRGIVISGRLPIAINYIKSVYFWVDLLSLIMSILQIILNNLESYNTGFNYIVFIKVIKVIQFDRNIKRYALKSLNALLIYQFVKNMLFLCLLCHIIGSFFFLIDITLINEGYYPEVGDDAFWLLTSYAYPQILHEDFWIQYVYCFYFSTQILSGIAYGDVEPQNPIETGFLCFVLLLPLVIYAYIFNSIYDVISKRQAQSRLIKKYQFLTKRYFRTLGVKPSLRSKLLTYLSFAYKKSVYGVGFIHGVAPSAKHKYLKRSLQKKFDFTIFDQITLLASFTDKQYFKDALINIIKEESFSERFLLVSPNKNCLYFINSGLVKKVVATDQKYSEDIRANSFANFYGFLTGRISKRFRYEGASFTIAQTINRNQFIEMLKGSHFQQLKEAYHLMAEQLLIYQNNTISGQKCFFCCKNGHIIDDCSFLRPPKTIYFYTKEEKRIPFRRKHHKFKRVREPFIFQKNRDSYEKTIQNQGSQTQDIHLGKQTVKIVEEQLHCYSLYYTEWNII